MHSDKASILWETLKERLNISEFQGMLLNLNELIGPNASLDYLEEPFT